MKHKTFTCNLPFGYHPYSFHRAMTHNYQIMKTPNQNADIADFIGQWSLEIEGNWVGWLDVRHEDGYIDSDLLWKWGSVSPAAHVHIQNKSLRVNTSRSPLLRNVMKR
jgi:hypothetical protein